MSFGAKAVGEWFAPPLGRNVMNIPRLAVDDEDELIWKASIHGSFTVKNAYMACIRARCGVVDDLWGLIWKCKVHERREILDLMESCSTVISVGTRIECSESLHVRNFLGAVVEALTVKSMVGSSLNTKLIAIQHACLQALHCGWSNVSIFSDCQVVVHGLLARTCPVWKARQTFDATLNSLSRIDNAKLCWISRTLNSAAHRLAAWAASNACFKLFFGREVAPLVASTNFGF
ncbi:hypothetical protein G4B88_017909 [Cannabis sativa]|uniref:RNase H type-1 domain-containing protein n=1 Tax=Cannabis sativa TaxID=3483 RepID=A0A7J6HK97_CANSA|nr:hypothetical protein G4B88_017909 [Cannabis sativa]